MDNLDKKLIMLLQKNGRKSYVEIMEDLGVGERTIRKRINELVLNGTIKISAIPKLSAFGFHFVGILAIQVQLHLLEETAGKLISNKNIGLLVRVTGRYDFIAIITACTLKDYGVIMDNIFLECPGIVRTETFSEISSYKGEIGDLDTIELINSVNFPSSKRYK